MLPLGLASSAGRDLAACGTPAQLALVDCPQLISMTRQGTHDLPDLPDIPNASASQGFVGVLWGLATAGLSAELRLSHSIQPHMASLVCSACSQRSSPSCAQLIPEEVETTVSHPATICHSPECQWRQAGCPDFGYMIACLSSSSTLSSACLDSQGTLTSPNLHPSACFTPRTSDTETFPICSSSQNRSRPDWLP